MTLAYVLASAAGGAAEVGGFSLGEVAALLGGVAALIGAVFGGYQLVQAHRASVSGDEVKAREQAATDKRDTIATWQAIADQKDRDYARVAEERDRWKARAEVLERESEDDRAVRMVHSAWDWQRVTEIHERGEHVEPPPPLLAQRPEHREGD